jgi:hypothetical protein
MARHSKLLLFATTLVALAFVAGACEVRLPLVDCSWINQPDSGGIICAGLQVVALQASVIALILAVALGLGVAIAQ